MNLSVVVDEQLGLKILLLKLLDETASSILSVSSQSLYALGNLKILLIFLSTIILKLLSYFEYGEELDG